MTIGLFVNPGDKGPGTPVGGRDNRSFEYDSLNDRLCTFPIEELFRRCKSRSRSWLIGDRRAISGRLWRHAALAPPHGYAPYRQFFKAVATAAALRLRGGRQDRRALDMRPSDSTFCSGLATAT